ncbi:sugar ABC transporter substrate-binding protein [Phytohabitans sp. ZYX-F-186]|uniref:Sugar ABC transporter substrate-binding protein n=1 Tax=Phytohabitans maris TaxID=3071409 RepID=A0ABU0ZBA6_9ACTN|nr:sugar ABC transporter substrate-binding protein [Phytohabitans sp. ZYX-F-186]MDQ7903636.1 sugar ABC transporter substrate-binding protein [Phytohabitans sp. ZYX-F-186]
MRAKLVTGVAAVVVVIVAVVAVALASGGSDDDPAAAHTVTWWSPNWDKEQAERLATEFEQQNPGTTVTIVETTWETMADKIRVALESGTAPDVITELTSRTGLYAAKGQLLDVSSWYTGSMARDDFLPSALDAVTLDGKLYGVPFRWDGSALIYNKDMLAAAGYSTPPATWAEFETMAKKLTANGVSGTAWPLGNDANTATRWIDQYFTYGGDFAVDGSAVRVDPAKAGEALDLIGSSIVDGWASKSSLEVDNTGLRDLFINKKVAMYVGGAFDVTPIQQAGINLGTALYPGVDGPGTVSADGFSFLVPAGTKNVDDTRKFVEFLAQPQNMAALTQTFPARTSAGNDPKFTGELIKPFFDQLAHAKPNPGYAGMTELTATIYSAQQSVGLARTSASSAGQQVADQAAKVLKP